MTNIVFLDGYTLNPGDLSWEAFEALGHFTVYDRTSRQDIIARAQDADILIVNKTALREEHLAQLPRLKYIGLACTGSDAIDVEAARQHGIVVTNIPDYSTESVAQMVFAFLFAVTTHVDTFAREVREGAWNRSCDFCFWKQPIIEVARKQIGIVGLGHIGMTVARIAAAMGMKVVAHTSKRAEELPPTISKMPLDQLLSTSDVISLNCPLTDSTRHMINADTLALLKPTAILINTARGRLIDEAALAEALHRGKLHAYCADVLGQEPPQPDNPLLTAPRTIITPHVAWASVESRLRLIDICTDNIRAFINGTPTNVL